MQTMLYARAYLKSVYYLIGILYTDMMMRIMGAIDPFIHIWNNETGYRFVTFIQYVRSPVNAIVDYITTFKMSVN